MSLGIVIKAPEGLVLAAESRLTLTAQAPDAPPLHVNFDNATKLLSFVKPNTSVGVVTYGQAAIGLRTAQSFIPEFEAKLAEDARRLPILEFAQKFSEFYLQQWNAAMPANYSGPNMTFIVAGFDEGEPYGKVFIIEIPRIPNPVAQQAGVGEFGITWGGQREIVEHNISGFRFKTVTQLQEYTKTLVSNIELRYEMAKNAYKRSHSFNMDVFKAKLEKIFGEIEIELKGKPIAIRK